MKKSLIVCLVCCLLLPCFAACKKEPSGTEKPTGTTPATSSVREEQTTAPELFPDRDLGVDEFRVLMSTEMQAYCWAEEEGASQVSDAVYSVYQAVGEKYGLDFVMDFESSQGKNTAKFNAKIENGVMSGYGKGYDLVMGQMHSISLAAQGYYKNLAKLDGLNLDADYYYHSINDSSTIEGQLYAVAGAYNMDKVSMSIVYFFNKSLHEDLFDGGEFSDLYEMVEDNSWTFENMRKMVIAAATENGDGQWDEKDRYGLIGTNTGVAALVGSGIVSVTQDAEAGYKLTFYGDRLEGIYSSYLDLFGREGVRVDGSYKNEAIFTSGNALFYSTHVNRLGVMNGLTSFKIGVLPFPKYEAEGDYRTYVNRSEVLFIPTNADADVSVTVMEYLNYLFLQDVVTAYWNQSLTSRFVADPIDAVMLEKARSCVFEDFGLTYTSLLDYFYAAAGDNLMKGTELVGWWGGISESVDGKIKALVEQYHEMASKNY